MLQEDPVLFQLYKDLVVSQVISAEEFWANRMNMNNTENSLSNKKQDVGISAAFLVSYPVNLVMDGIMLWPFHNHYPSIGELACHICVV